MDAIPPTKAALVLRIKRGIFQGGHCWDKMLPSQQICNFALSQWLIQGTIELWMQRRLQRTV